MEERLQIAICEDNKTEEDKLTAILKEAAIKNHYTVFRSAEQLLEIYRPQAFDLLLMDIYMDGMTGVEAVSRIRQVDPDVPVAFITTSTNFALESYRLSALKYIEKPYGKKDVEDILKLARMEQENAPGLTVSRGGKEHRIRLSQIVYIEAKGRLLMIHLKSGEVPEVYAKMSDILPQLDTPSFFSSHKSYCVNLAQVQYIDQELKCFVTSDRSNIPIRRELMGKARKALESYLFTRTREDRL